MSCGRMGLDLCRPSLLSPHRRVCTVVLRDVSFTGCVFHRRRIGTAKATRIHKLLTAVGSRCLSPSYPSCATSSQSASEASTPLAGARQEWQPRPEGSLDLMHSAAAIILGLVLLLPAVLVGGLFLWAARKDGEEDKALQARLGNPAPDTARALGVEPPLSCSAPASRSFGHGQQDPSC
jgi:hypothetical protein